MESRFILKESSLYDAQCQAELKFEKGVNRGDAIIFLKSQEKTNPTNENFYKVEDERVKKMQELCFQYYAIFTDYVKVNDNKHDFKIDGVEITIDSRNTLDKIEDYFYFLVNVAIPIAQHNAKKEGK